jgi:ribosomal protein S18 acetylase RimI-like enzyme
MIRGRHRGRNEPETTTMSLGFALRPAVREDIAAILDVWRRAEVIPSETDTAADLTRLLRHDAGALLLAVAGDEIVGTVIATWDGWRAGLWRLAVLPDWRRRGVARALVAEAERRLHGKGARRMSVLAESNDPRAMAFWEARTDMGYERDPGARRFVKMLSRAAID